MLIPNGALVIVTSGAYEQDETYGLLRATRDIDPKRSMSG